MFADFFLQTGIMLRARDDYLHVGRLLHVLVHASLTAVVLILVKAPPMLVLCVFVAELIVHFHIDFFKSRITVKRALRPTQARYWWAMGVDQALHQLTYVAIVGAWLWQSGAIPAQGGLPG